MLRFKRWVLLVSFKWSAQPNINCPLCEGFFFTVGPPTLSALFGRKASHPAKP